jgi:hypothetical protein
MSGQLIVNLAIVVSALVGVMVDVVLSGVSEKMQKHFSPTPHLRRDDLYE